ncbi:DNA mismatch repair protein MLH1-like [Cornus florida]|uniref:DNA mismatch repair protein MLH1-like n=1 Tax=Cornus florida TaxID=4283 RepID=UPI0028969A5E|nr:DNA mismatch repair protein MLH1-like [Cornus florida]
MRQSLDPSPSSLVPTTISPPSGSKLQKVPVNKMVRTDSLDPAGRLHAYLQAKAPGQLERNCSLTSVRYVLYVHPYNFNYSDRHFYTLLQMGVKIA